MDHDPADFALAIAGELRAERGRTKLTVGHLVAETGISKSAVLHYLNGQRDIPLRALARLCRALDVSPVEIAARAEARLTQGKQRGSTSS